MKSWLGGLPRTILALSLVGCGVGAPEPSEDVAEALSACSPLDPDCGAIQGPRCISVQDAAPGRTSTYTCNASLDDKYGHPIAGARVHLSSAWCNYYGTEDLGEVVGTIGRGGSVVLSGSLPRGNRISCWVETTNAENTSAGLSRTTPIVSATLNVHALRTPEPTLTRAVTGLDAGDAQMDLYQSGAYDKVLIVVEHFDPDENDPTARRDRTRLWNTMGSLMTQLFNDGWDVWLFQPHHTGENLHEQSAELAQAIQLAARTFGGVPRCGGGEITLLGFNSGGLVGRMATARWERDTAWTTALGISGPLPVNALGTIDSPHYGWNFNIDFQRDLFTNRSAAEIWSHTNLDSCAAAQLTRRRYDARSWFTGGISSIGWQAFFQTGASFGIRSLGADVTCAGGPPLVGANPAADSWPTSVRLFGFSNGTPAMPNRCYGDVADLNGGGRNLCADIAALGGVTHIPQVGDAFVQVSVSGAPDRYWNVSSQDLEPGSRNPTFLDRQTGWWSAGLPGMGGVYMFRQRFSPTFIPSHSADGTDSPTGLRSSRFAEFEYNQAQNFSSDVVTPPAEFLIARNLNAAGLCP